MAIDSNGPEQVHEMASKPSGFEKTSMVANDPYYVGSVGNSEPLDTTMDVEAAKPRRTKGQIALTMTALGVCFTFHGTDPCSDIYISWLAFWLHLIW